MLELTILSVVSIINILLGYIVYSKNPRSATNRLFLFLVLSFVGWSVVSYVSVHPFGLSQLWWARLVLFFAVILCVAVYQTFTVFPGYKMPEITTRNKLLMLFSGIVMILTLTPLVFKDLSFKNGTASPVVGVGIAVFALAVIALLGGGIINLFKKYSHSRGREKLQMRYVLLGLAGSFSLIFLTNFVFVVAFKNSKPIQLGPSFTLIFSGAMAYAIVKHRLFDIRTAVARGLAYLLALVTIGLIYGAIVFGLLESLGSSQQLSASQRLLYVAFALFTAILFPGLKKFFDKVTNRIFFRDSYDSQKFLDHLNAVLVRTIKIDDLVSQSSKLITQTLKADEISFLLLNKGTVYRLLGNKKINTNDKNLDTLVNLFDHFGGKLVVSDELQGEDGDHNLHNKLEELGVSIAVKLDTHQQHIGYLLFGQKRGGNAYSLQDIGLLEIISNEMALAIQNALRFEEIQQFNVTLQEKIDEATHKLRNANKRLKDIDETKDDFISMASHQLRTPLTSMKGYVSMVLEGDVGKITKQQQDLLAQAFASSQRMVFLISDLLNVSRLKTGKFVIDATPTDLSAMIDDEISQLKETAATHQLELSYDKPPHFPLLKLDETKTRQVIMNFIDNAIYYTPKGGHIKIELVEKPSSIECTVSDDGIGVPKAEQHHLFTKFYRADNAKKARPDGTGLGLFMAQKVVIAQGGAIIFHSEENKGSTFGFSFPKEKLLVKKS